MALHPLPAPQRPGARPPLLSPDGWKRVAPFVLFMLLLALRGEAPGWFPGLDARWLYALQTVAVGGLLLWWWRTYGELTRQNLPTLGEAALAVGVGLAIFGLWIVLTAPWMVIGEATATFVPLTADGQLDWGLIAWRTAGAALVVPVMEELFWRSFLMRWVDDPVFQRVAPEETSARALIVSTFVFTLVHTQWLAAAIAGLAYALLYRRSGKLWLAVLAHATTNAALAAHVVTTRQWAFW